MPRRARAETGPGTYHVTTRGVDGAAMFRDDVDRFGYLIALADVVQRHEWTLFLYCLLGNHTHFVVRTSGPTLGVGMQRLNWRHAYRFNRRHSHTGHHLGERYHAKSVLCDAHLLEACRYVDLNPLCAGLCQDPADWPWSSHRAAVGLVEAPEFLAVDEILGLFSLGDQAASLYREFVLGRL